MEESRGFVGAVLGPPLPYSDAAAAEPHATVVGGDHGAPLGHQLDISSSSSESSSSCELSDSDVRIIEPPFGKGPPTDPAFRIGAEEQPAAQGNRGGGGAGRRKHKRQVPPPTVRDRPHRRRVRALGVPSGPKGGGGGQACPQVGVEAVPPGIPPTP